ncbi:helix-turn-helix domain-containing protein [Puniceibacterium confluentis]|uniref:helix-turn-helix domain-containing protein n=1 Tax=Puniceibacterium confluentis TaxID=1958944 RepID=UPI001647DBAF|nr:helix-turn-helix transcriptional regulator [Puniceibacterium confluentis]
MKKLVNALVPNESRPERVGPRISALRESMSVTKAQLADSIGLDRSTLTKVEKGQIGLDIAKGEAIAAIYGFGLDFIYRGDLSDVPDRYREKLLIQMIEYRAT